MKTCEDHSIQKKTCIEVLREGNCKKEDCSTFKRVKQMYPKFVNLNTLVSRGVIPTTVWDFRKDRSKQIRKAKDWLKKYPQEMFE